MRGAASAASSGTVEALRRRQRRCVVGDGERRCVVGRGAALSGTARGAASSGTARGGVRGVALCGADCLAAGGSTK
nr:hypothetical protein Iba_chr01cCG7160 [Ipomoea batatas]GMD08357.1 hypothetical protein Iba_chr06cCG15880 [Ipomoea batatas]